MAHLRPLEQHEIADTPLLDMMAHYARTRGFVPNSIRTMARRPEIAKRFGVRHRAQRSLGVVHPAMEWARMALPIALLFAYNFGPAVNTDVVESPGNTVC